MSDPMKKEYLPSSSRPHTQSAHRCRDPHSTPSNDNPTFPFTFIFENPAKYSKTQFFMKGTLIITLLHRSCIPSHRPNQSMPVLLTWMDTSRRPPHSRSFPLSPCVECMAYAAGLPHIIYSNELKWNGRVWTGHMANGYKDLLGPSCVG